MAGFDENIAVMGVDWECSQTNVLGGGLRERIASKAGFNALRLNTDFSIESSLKSPCLGPETLLESPVFLSNPLGQPSPTTGKFTFLPGVNSKALSSDKEKDEFFDDIGSSSTFFQGTTEMISGDYHHYSNRCSHQGSNLYGVEADPSVEEKTSDGTVNTWLKTLDHQEAEEEEEEEGHGDLMVSGALGEDGYNWRKYGQKLVKGSEYPRSYYKCTDPNCEMKKNVERSKEGYITEIIYKGAHNHSKPLPNRRSGIQIDSTEQVEQQRDSAATYTQQQGGNNIEQGSTEFEYGNQTRWGGDIAAVVDASSTFSNDEDDRGTQGSVSLSHDEGEGDESESKRRKLAEMRGTTRGVREARVIVETRSDIDILDDGYRWRKYGQKVVKGNPNPRSYYKCTANGCNVRKHVERASHDLKSVITSYEGKHIHDVPAPRNTRSRGSSVFQSQHYYNGQPRSRFEIEAPTTTNQSSFLVPPTGFSLCQTGLADISIPGLAFGQGNLPVMPHLYLTRSFGVSEELMQKVETVSDLGQSVYNQILDRLP